MHRHFSLGVVLSFAAVYVIWGTTYLAIAISLRTLPPFMSGSVRFLIAGALMYAWLRLRGPRPFAGLNWPQAALCGVLMTGMGNGFVVWAQQGVPSGIAALIVGSLPIYVLALDWLFFSKRRPQLQAVAGITLALAGVVLIVTQTRSLSGQARPVHLVVLFTAVLAWSVGTLLQRRVSAADKVLSFTSLQMLAAGVFQGFMAAVNREWLSFDATAVSLESVLAVVYLIAFGSIVAFSCYLYLLAHVSAQQATTYALVNPVIALILGAIVLDERITPLAVVSAALVLLGVALVLFQGSIGVSQRQRRLADGA